VTSAVAAIGATASNTAPAQVATAVIAGGQSGSAFALASRIVLSMRLAMLRRAVAAVLAVCLLPGAVGVLLMQQSRAQSLAPDLSHKPVPIALNLPPAPATRPTTRPARVALPDEIRKALVRTAGQMGPITLACTMQSSSTYTKERAMTELKLREHDASFNAGARHEYRMEWQDHKYRSEFRAGEWPGMPENHVKSQHLVGAFDGETVYLADEQARPDDPNLLPQGSVTFRVPVAVTPTREYKLDNRGWTHGEWFFTMAGWRLPLSFGELKSNAPPRSQIIYLLDEGGAVLTAVDRVDLDQQACMRLTLVTINPDRKRADEIDPDEWVERMKKLGVAESEENLLAMAAAMREERKLPELLTQVFYVDPKLNYALRRAETRYVIGSDQSILLTRTDCADFQQLPGRELFIPRTCVASWYTSNMLPGKYFDAPTVTFTYRVTELKLDAIDDARFSTHYEQPGCEIIDVLDEEGNRRHVVIQDDGTAREQGR
jgi:hypothetical protein